MFFKPYNEKITGSVRCIFGLVGSHSGGVQKLPFKVSVKRLSGSSVSNIKLSGGRLARPLERWVIFFIFFRLLKIFSDKILCFDNFQFWKFNIFQNIEMPVVCNQKIGISAHCTVNKFLVIFICERKLKSECRINKNHIVGSQEKKPELFKQFSWKYSL